MQLFPPQGVGIISHEWHRDAVMFMAARPEVSLRAVLLLKSSESQSSCCKKYGARTSYGVASEFREERHGVLVLQVLEGQI